MEKIQTIDYLNTLENTSIDMYNNTVLKGVTPVDKEINNTINSVNSVPYDTQKLDEYFNIQEPIPSSRISFSSRFAQYIFKYIPNIKITSINALENPMINAFCVKSIDFVGENPATGSFQFLSNGGKLIYFGKINNIDTSQITNFSSMFTNNKNLQYVDTSWIDTSSAINLSNMFYSCISLKSIDVSNFNTSNVTKFDSMFYNCTSLITLDISNFIISSNATIRSMFGSCKNLISIKIPSLNNSDYSSLFIYLESLKDISFLNNISFDNCTNTNYMFGYCGYTGEIDLSNKNMSLVKNISFMFYYSKFSKIVLPNLYNITNAYDLFGCSEASEIIINNMTFDKNNINSSGLRNMFYQSNIVDIDLSNIDFNLFKNYMGMFQNCSKLESLKINIIFGENADIGFLFSNCSNLKVIDGILDFQNYSSDEDLNTSSNAHIFYRCDNLESVRIKNLQSNFNINQTWTNLTKIDEESINYLLNNVQDVTSSPKTIKINEAVLARASADAIAHAESLGWTVTT